MSRVEGAQASTGGALPIRRRIALVVAALVLAAAGWTLHRGRVADLDRLFERARELELVPIAGGELDRALRRESDPGEQRLVLARALLDAALRTAPAGDEELLLDRLAEVGALAVEALRALPASAEAPHLLGTALALERLARRDPALLTAAEDWESPLELARRRAPGNVAAERALAAAYLEIWPGLTGERRARAERSLRAAFEDPLFRSRALERWLELAGSIDAASELLPDLPDSWNRLLRAAAAEGDLALAIALAARETSALERTLDARLARALELAARRDGDGSRGARAEIDALLALSPADVRFSPRFARALAARPPGPAGAEFSAAAKRWLTWARPLVLLGFEPLPAAALTRLAGAVGAEVPPEQAAWAALAAGERARAELLARRSDALWSEAWAPYLLLDARRHLESGQPAEARRVLAEVHRNQHRRLAWRRLARAAGVPAASETAGVPAASERWQPTEWEIEERVPRLAFETTRPARGLRIELAAPVARPTLLAAELDGRALPPFPLAAGEGIVDLPLELPAGPHLLRLTARAGALPALGLTTLD